MASTEEINALPFDPDERTRQFLTQISKEFSDDRDIKNQGIALLSYRTMQQIWDEALSDYNVLVPPKRKGDWIVPYASALTQDAVNKWWATLTQDWIFPEITAVNKQNEISRTIGRAMAALLKQAKRTDGYPSENGYLKFSRQTLGGLISGTFHTFVDVYKGRNITSIIPNEEVYVPNFYEPNVQKQGHFIWVQEGVTYDELRMIFGGLENWKYVSPGQMSKWNSGVTPLFRNFDNGIVQSDRCQVLRRWAPVPDDELKKGMEQDKYFNIIIQGIPMFDPENRSPFRHGFYPVVHGKASDWEPNFYWGKGIPHLMREDKKMHDKFKMVVLNKSILNLVPPIVALNGINVTQDAIRPAQITKLKGDINAIQKIPGVAEAVTNADLGIIQNLKTAVGESSADTNPAGTNPKSARHAQQQTAEAQLMMQPIGKMLSFAVEAEAWLMCQNIIQFYPQNKIKKIVVPDQTLRNGKRGNMEVQFEKIKPMDQQGLLDRSESLMKQQNDAMEEKEPKEIIVLNQDVLDQIDLYIEVTANPVERQSIAMEQAKTLQNAQFYMSAPNSNKDEVLRMVARANNDNEDLIVQQPPPPAPSQSGSPPNGPPNAMAPNQNEPGQGEGIETPAGNSINQQVGPLGQLG